MKCKKQKQTNEQIKQTKRNFSKTVEKERRSKHHSLKRVPLNVWAISAQINYYKATHSTVTFWILFEATHFNSLLQVTRQINSQASVEKINDKPRKKMLKVGAIFFWTDTKGLFEWRGAWNKVLSDTWCNVKFYFCFTSKYKAIWKENLAVNQTSFSAFFHEPLQIKYG